MSIDSSRRSPLAAVSALGLITLCGLLAACATEAPPPAPVATPTPTPVPVVYEKGYDYFQGKPEAESIPPALAAATDGLRAAAIHDVLNDPMAGSDFKQARAFFIAVGPKATALTDPTTELLARIKAGAPVKKYSQCVAGESGVRDAASGERGVVIKVSRICWTGPNRALLEYGYGSGGIHGHLTMAEAVRDGAGVWTFTPRKMSIY